MADPIKSYKLSPQLKAELNFASRRNKRTFQFDLPRASAILSKLPWKAIGITVVVFAVVISAYLGVKKGYDYVAEKNHQADLARQKDYENHLAGVRTEVSAYATTAFDFVTLSQNYIKSGDGERAEAAAVLATEKDPLWRDGFINLGQVYMSVNKFSEAKGALDLALKRDPTFGQTHYLLSLVYQELRDDTRAKDEFAKAKVLGFQTEIGG